MKRLLLVLIFTFVFLSSVAISQEWDYLSDFVNSSDKCLAMPHGVVVTPDGRIWIGYYFPSEYVDGDSIHTLWVHNPDGTVHHKIRSLIYPDLFINSAKKQK